MIEDVFGIVVQYFKYVYYEKDNNGCAHINQSDDVDCILCLYRAIFHNYQYSWLLWRRLRDTENCILLFVLIFNHTSNNKHKHVNNLSEKNWRKLSILSPLYIKIRITSIRASIIINSNHLLQRHNVLELNAGRFSLPFEMNSFLNTNKLRNEEKYIIQMLIHRHRLSYFI